jgi:hypothetical protein
MSGAPAATSLDTYWTKPPVGSGPYHDLAGTIVSWKLPYTEEVKLLEDVRSVVFLNKLVL